MQWLAAASAGNLEVIRGMLQLHREGSTGGAERPWTLDLNWCDHVSVPTKMLSVIALKIITIPCSFARER